MNTKHTFIVKIKENKTTTYLVTLNDHDKALSKAENIAYQRHIDLQEDTRVLKVGEEWRLKTLTAER